MTLDSTKRFTDRVDDYVKYRPDYPASLYRLLADQYGLAPEHTIADLGAGTGLLALLFLERGHPVFGVEPNEAMLRAGERELARFAGYRSVQATAEETQLSDGSIDMVVAGQAFHWFDPDRTRSECLRILKPSGPVVLVWNTWHQATSAFMKSYSSIVQRYTNEDFENHHSGEKQQKNVSRFFNAGCQTHSLEHRQRFDRAGLQGRLLSSSYAPKAGHPKHSPMLAELDHLFEENCDGAGMIDFELRTQVFVGRLAAA